MEEGASGFQGLREDGARVSTAGPEGGGGWGPRLHGLREEGFITGSLVVWVVPGVHRT